LGRDKTKIDGLVNCLINNARNNNLMLGRPAKIVYDEAYKGKAALGDTIQRYKRECRDDLQLIVFVIPKDDHLYASIKFLCELDFGIVSQCVSQDKSRSFENPAYVSNVLLKINSKLGGQNSHLKRKEKNGDKISLPTPLMRKTMIVGLDVNQRSKIEQTGFSIASAVATFDRDFVNYFSTSRIQPTEATEIVSCKDIFFELLENFISRNNTPDNIIVFREGVSDGEFKGMMKEVQMIKEACSSINPTYSPKIVFIVVQKKHHIRFLPDQKKCDFKSGNSIPGLAVDTGIVSNYYEFFLTSHRGLKGTSRPARYTVIYDNSPFSSDDLQKTVYYLCHLFARCSKAVGLVPPLIYSHLKGKRVRFYLSSMPQYADLGPGQEFFAENAKRMKALNEQTKVKPSLKNRLHFI